MTSEQLSRNFKKSSEKDIQVIIENIKDEEY